ncbi:hypothetical protein D3C77_524880 [compost metagenome]
MQQHQCGSELALLEQRHADQTADLPFAVQVGLGDGARVVQHIVDHHQIIVLQVVVEVTEVGEMHPLAAVARGAVAPVALDGGVEAAGLDAGEQHPCHTQRAADDADRGVGDGLAVVLLAQQVA